MLAAPEELLRFKLKETLHCRAPRSGAKDGRVEPANPKTAAPTTTWQFPSASGILREWGLAPHHSLCFS